MVQAFLKKVGGTAAVEPGGRGGGVGVHPQLYLEHEKSLI